MDLEQLNLKHYREALGGVGPQAAQWADKPHRLVYDLCSEIERLRAQTEKKGNSVKLEQLSNGNLLFNGVEFGTVGDDDRDRLLKRLIIECEGWEVFFGNGQKPDQNYYYEIHLGSFGWESNGLARLATAEHRTIYRRQLKQSKQGETEMTGDEE